MVPPHVYAKQREWAKQSNALGAPYYRVTLTARRDGLSTFNYGKGKGESGEEKLYTAADVRELIPYLARQNKAGYDIYITPMSPGWHYMVLDDTTAERLASLIIEHGVSHCLVQESSPGNLQAVFRVSKDMEGKDEQSLANRIVVWLNQGWGDPKFSGVIHPFRMAGFANAKQKYEAANGSRPLVRLVDYCNRPCKVLGGRLDMLRREAKAAAGVVMKPTTSRSQPTPTQAAHPASRHAPDRDPATQFATELRQVRALVISLGWQPDPSAMDYRAALAMLEGGWSADEVREGMLGASPGLAERHKSIVDYVERTVAAALVKARSGVAEDSGSSDDAGMAPR